MAINRVIIEGNLTRDVEMRATASGLAVAGFTVAVNEKRKNAEGEYVDAPVFVKCSLFGTRAEKLSKYLLKGVKVTLAVAGFTVAVNEKRKNAEGEYVDAPVFVKCSLFGTRAEKLSKYLLKGVKVTIDGKLRYSQWVKDDEKRHELSIIVDQLEFSGGKREQTGDAPATPYEPSHAAPAPVPEPELDLYDEDIPF